MAGIIASQYRDENAARAHVEKARWPDGPVCPHCGVVNEAYRLTPRPDSKEPVRHGVWKCKACEKQFTATVGTIFEDSHIPLHKWLLAIHLMCSSKKGISAHQLWRNLWGVDENGKQLGSYRTAWFMAHRIRWALGQEPIAAKLKGIIEIDETYIGGKRTAGPTKYRWSPGGRPKPQPRPTHPRMDKAAVVSVLQRDGNVHSTHVARVTGENLKPIVRALVDEQAHVMTDSGTSLKFPSNEWSHHTVNHKAKEYVRHEDGLTITTNTVEGYFGILKRGINGVYHHVGKSYLDQYLREFDYRYNVREMNDDARAALALKKTEGKRLMLKDPKVF